MRPISGGRGRGAVWPLSEEVMSVGDPPGSALLRLKKVLATDAETLKWKSAVDPAASPLASVPDVPTDVGTWRADCYRQLARLRPDLSSREVAGMAIELSRDPVLIDRDPARVAIEACDLLEQSRR